MRLLQYNQAIIPTFFGEIVVSAAAVSCGELVSISMSLSIDNLLPEELRRWFFDMKIPPLQSTDIKVKANNRVGQSEQ